MDAALGCFERHGFRATTIERIADAAGTTVPTFYRHFASKNELLGPLCEVLTTEVAKTVSLLSSGGWRTREGVRRWLDDYVIMWRRVHRLCTAFWEASDADPGYATRAIAETLGVVMLVPEFIDAVPTSLRASAKLRLSLTLLMLDRMVMLAEAEERPEQSSAIIDEFAEIMWTSVFCSVAQAGVESRSRASKRRS